MSIKPPYRITRTPRSIIANMAHLKASELRSFMLIYGLPCLWGLLPNKYFQHFLSLVDAVFLLFQDSLNCQNKVSADQYHLTVSRAQVSTHRGRVFFWSYPLTRYLFSNDRRLTFNFFLKFIWKMLCLCAAQLKFWFQTDLGCENSVSCYRQGRQLLLTFLTMFTRWSRSTSRAIIGQRGTLPVTPLGYLDSKKVIFRTMRTMRKQFPLTWLTSGRFSSWSFT